MSMKSMKPESATSFEKLPEELWREIFCRVPHDSRLRCLSVSQKWYRFLLELEDELKEANPGSPQLLVLEKKVENGLQWSALDPVSSKKTRMKLSWSPGWDPAVHGSIQGGGRSGLVALCAKASQYWVGSPVHDKWEKVPVLNTFQDLPFHRRGFHFIPQGRRYRRDFALKPAVPCFKPLKEWPPEDEQNAERSGFYSIVQFQVNETHERWPEHDRKFANWVLEVYNSRSRSWEMMARPFPEFRSLIHSCVSGNSVYFLAALEPSRELLDDPRLGAYLDELPCPVSVWDYRLDTGALSCKLDWLFFDDHDIEKCWRSLQLRESKGGDVSIISVGYPRGHPDEVPLYKLTCGHPMKDPCEEWNIEKGIELGALCDGDMGFHEHIHSDSQDCGFNFMAFNRTEGHLDDLHEFAYAARTEYLERAAAEVTGSTSIVYFSAEERLWKRWEVLCPLHRDGVLPVVPFLLCCDTPCST